MSLRLQKILSQAGVASRRAAERLIAEGRVTINGRTVSEMGTKADPEADDIRVDGRRVKSAERRRYILLYKPAGYVTTRSDPQRRRTVVDLLAGIRECVYPVGRLDYDSEGLLLLTNDGDLAARLTHPRHGVERTYEARVAGMQADEKQPGYRHIIFKPQPVSGMTQIHYSTTTSYGEGGIEWKQDGNQFAMDVVVPVGCTATVFVPTKEGQNVSLADGIESEFVNETGKGNGFTQFEVQSGRYRFEVR